jgi:hypothetical protein
MRFAGGFRCFEEGASVPRAGDPDRTLVMAKCSEKLEKKSVRLKVSPRAGRIIKGQVPASECLQAVRGQAGLSDGELLSVLFYFGHGADRTLRREAAATLCRLPEERLAELIGDAEIPPQVLDFVARHRSDDERLRQVLLAHPALAEATRRHLAAEGRADEESLEGLSKYQQSLRMGVAEKIKTALTGDKEWRKILMTDANKLVSSGVLKNPRITEDEVLTLARNRTANEELIRLITLNREWIKSYSIKLALVMHPRTPLPKVLRYMSILSEKDIRSLARSKDVSSVVSNNARRIVMARQKK